MPFGIDVRQTAVGAIAMGAFKGALGAFGIKVNLKAPGKRKRTPRKGLFSVDAGGLPGKVKGRR